MTILFWLLVGHFVADMALQPIEMSKGKNRHNKPEYVPRGQKFVACWPYFLSGHAAVHAGAVALVTGSVLIGFLEFLSHWLIDFLKCENAYTPHVDQALHFTCKIIWLTMVW